MVTTALSGCRQLPLRIIFVYDVKTLSVMQCDKIPIKRKC